MSLENYFKTFRDNIVGINTKVDNQTILYTDWTASGRLYQPIEDFISKEIGPLVANTHTEASYTGCSMTRLYHEAQHTIKEHVNANDSDVLICSGGGMTTVVNKFQRMLNLRIPEKWAAEIKLAEEDMPVVFITHMEHHSNQTTWEECAVTVVRVPEDVDGLPDVMALDKLLQQYSNRAMKIGSFTACSNVTGIKTDYRSLAKMMHQHGGVCFIDFAASAPYVDIDMHPNDPMEKLDAVMFSPHKFLGGPGSSGVLVFDKKLYSIKTPDEPGGGTVTWTNPWGAHHYYDDIEVREDGGTPAFLQTIKTALAIKVKEQMGTHNIQQREEELCELFFAELSKIPNINILHDKQKDRLCMISFYVTDIHFNLIVRLLSDRFGIQSRGGCSCAGTYGHILLGVDESTSESITCQIDAGDLTRKPGWVRVSLHPTTTDKEVIYIAHSINSILENIEAWELDYQFDCSLGDYIPKQKNDDFLSLKAFDTYKRA